MSAPFSFGLGTGSSTPQAPTTTAGGISFGFGTPAAAAAPSAGTGLTLGGFGTSTATVQPFSFGAATPSAPPASSAPSSFGFNLGGGTISSTSTQPTTTSAPFSFGLGTPASQASTAAATSNTLTLSSGLTPLVSTAAPQTTGGITFGAPTATSAAATTSTGLTLGGFGTTTATVQPFSFGTATSSAPPASSAPSAFGFNLGGTLSSTATQPTSTSSTVFAGLGGVPPSSGGGLGGGPSGGTAKPEGRAVLDLPLPMELMQIVEELKTHMKNQKVKMSEVCRATDKGIDKVTEEVEETRLAVSILSNQVHRQVLFCGALMHDTQEEMKNLDMAMITKDTPYVLQNEIVAPTNYFFNLINNYHERMLIYKREIERAETALGSLGQSNMCSPKDLVAALKGTKQMVIALAAKVQDLHEHIVNEMAVNRNLRRFPGEEGTTPSRRGISVSGGLIGHPERLVSPHYEQAYDKVNALFFTPQKPGGGGSEYIFRQGHSTPILSTGMGFTSPGPLYQTTSSTILGSPGGALKRTKH